MAQWLRWCLVPCSFQKQAAAFKYLYLFGLWTTASPKVCCTVGSPLTPLLSSRVQEVIWKYRSIHVRTALWWKMDGSASDEQQLWQQRRDKYDTRSITEHLVGIHLAVCRQPGYLNNELSVPIALFSLCWQLQTKSFYFCYIQFTQSWSDVLTVDTQYLDQHYLEHDWSCILLQHLLSLCNAHLQYKLKGQHCRLLEVEMLTVAPLRSTLEHWSYISSQVNISSFPRRAVASIMTHRLCEQQLVIKILGYVAKYLTCI